MKQFESLTIPAAPSQEYRLSQLQDEIYAILAAPKLEDWAKSRQFDTDKWKITYDDGGMISMSDPTFTCLVGNREIQVDTLEEAEDWLWRNHSVYNYCGNDDGTGDAGTGHASDDGMGVMLNCPGCLSVHVEHTHDEHCALGKVQSL